MSSPSTPTRSAAGSASSTPGSSSDAPPAQLTPRSKIRAMMAAIDEISDDETDEKRSMIPTRLRVPLLTSNIGSDETALSGSRSNAGEEEDSDEDDIIKPRGKLAARLQNSKSMNPDDIPMEEKKRQETVTSKPDDPAGEKQASNPRPSASDESSSGESTLSKKEADRKTSPRTIPSVKGKFLLRRKNRPVETEQRDEPGMSQGESLDRARTLESPQQYSSANALSLSSRDPKAVDSPKIDIESGSEANPDPAANARFLALVARKKEERRKKDAEEERKREERQSAVRRLARSLSDDETDDNDLDAGRKLTQQSRPSRKASKKAIEEMSRETQRISRNMQLAHEAKTKKKFTKEAFLERFKPRRAATPTTSKDASSPATSSVTASDVEGAKAHQTPPTSPVGPESKLEESYGSLPLISAPLEDEMVVARVGVEDDVPYIDDLLANSFTLKRKDKGKGKEKAFELPSKKPNAELQESTRQTFAQRPIKIHPPKNPVPPSWFGHDSESDLEIIPTKKKGSRKLDIFDRLPAKKASEGEALLKLRALAHLTSPSRRSISKSSMNATELQASLQRRARQQAAMERAEKIQDLRDRGIIVQTGEERERDQAQVEDMLERARREGEELTKREKVAAKKEARENGEDVTLIPSDEDEDYEEEAEASAPELSGSEEELAEQGELEIDEDEESDKEEALAEKGDSAVAMLVDDQASEGSEHDERERELEAEAGTISEEDLPRTYHKRRSNNRRVLDEDDDQENLQESPAIQKPASPENVRNPFALATTDFGGAPLGLTQAFAATMADTQSEEPLETPEQDSITVLREMPTPEFPVYEVDTQAKETQDSMHEVDDIDLHFTQSQVQQDTVQGQPPTATQYSEMPDPTQDAGFGLSSPVSARFAPVPPSTADTVIVPSVQVYESPVIKKKGRLQRRAEALPAFSDVEESDVHSEADDADLEVTANAFDVMKKSFKKPNAEADVFDKKKSHAKGMVQEQAEESEDEYAGLGGASDDESGGEEDEEVKKMIDEGEVDVDERKLAAFYADKERATDEKAIEKLYKDINNGMLRRKRGAEFDLSDSDDDIEDRRRRKRAEFQRMRKALLENENIGKIAEDPKKLAFLRAIEDREEDADDFEDFDVPENGPDNSQSGNQSTQEVPESQIENTDSVPAEAALPLLGLNKRKRAPLEESTPSAGNRPPPALRRSAPRWKKPSTLAEIRDSVSFLTEDQRGTASRDASSSDDDDDDVNGGVADPSALRDRVSAFAPRRRRHHHQGLHATTTAAVVDRISLKRAESANAAAAEDASSAHLAFHDPLAALSAAPGFRVPSLLRRATTQGVGAGFGPGAADANGISHGVTAVAGMERAAGGEKGEFVRRGGTKRSSVNYMAREKVGGGVVQGVERRREEGRMKVAEGRRGVLGKLAGGVWE